MRKRVNLSTYSVIVTILSMTILAGVLFVVFSNPDSYLVTRIGAVIIVLLFCLSGLFYAPLAISIDDDALRVHRPLRSKVISLTDIADVRLCKPTMAERRLCGSGGFLGHWGRMYDATWVATSPITARRAIASLLLSTTDANICLDAKMPPKWLPR